MSEAAAATPPPAAPSSHDSNAGTLTDRIMSKIGDDFSLGIEYESPSQSSTTRLVPEDFDDGDDDGDDDAEDTKREKPAPKKAPAEPEKPKKAAAEPPREREEAPEKPAAPKPVLREDRGTEDKPYAVTDLPDDRFVRIKVEGKEQTLPMRELADGYIRKQAFDAAYSQSKQAVVDAKRIAETHLADRKQLFADLDGLFGSAPKMFETLMGRDSEVMLHLGQLIGEQYGKWQADPGSMQRHNNQRQQRQLQAERARIDEDRKAWETQRQRQEAAERNNAQWAPVWREALKEAGFPKPTPEFKRAVRALLTVAEQDAGNGKLTPEVFKACVAQAARLSGAETVNGRKPPPQAAPEPREPNAARVPRSEKKWEGMSHHEKFRDPDWILRKRK